MTLQRLVNVITATVPATTLRMPVEHGLKSGGTGVAPTFSLPKRQTPVYIDSVDETYLYLSNPSSGPITVTMRCERGLSNELDATSLTPFFMNTGDGGGSGGVTELSVLPPITRVGPQSNPTIGITLGSVAESACAGDDPRLSNSRTPSGAASGDLSGSFPSPTVSRVQGVSFSATPPAAGQVLQYNGTQYAPVLLTVSQSQVTGLSAALASKADTSIEILAGDGLTGGGNLTASRTISMPAVGLPNTYGTAARVPVLTTDVQGRVSGVVETDILIDETQVTNLVTDLIAINDELGNISTDVTTLQGNVSTLQGEMFTAQGDITALQADTASIHGDISLLQSDVAGLQGAVSSVQGDVTTLQGDVTSLQGSVSFLQSDVSTLQGNITTIQADLLNKVPTSRQVIAGTGLSGGGALTSDVTLSLPNVGTAGTYGSASSVAVVTTDAQGRVSLASSTPIAITQTQVDGLTGALSGKVPDTRQVLAGTGLSGGGALTADVTVSMPNVGTAGVYGSATQVPVLTTDAQGRVSAVTNTDIGPLANSALTNSSLTVTAGTGLTGGGLVALGGSTTLSIANTTVTASSYGTTAAKTVSFTVNAQGQLTAASQQDIAILASQVTSGTFPVGVSVQAVYQEVTAAISGGSAALTKGQVVYLKSGGGSASAPAIDLSLASAAATALTTIGVVASASIANNNVGSIITSGVLTGLNTNGFNQGDILYVDATTPGLLTNVMPTYPNTAVPVAIVIVKNATMGAIYVDIEIDRSEAPQVKMPSPATKVTITSAVTSLASSYFSNPAIEYLVFDVSGPSNVTLTTPIQALGTTDYGRRLTVHNVSATRSIIFNTGGTAYLSGGVNLTLGPNSIVSFVWSFVGGGVGRWVQTTPAITVS